MAPDEVIAKYHDLWNVERSFRMFKGDLSARPLFARRKDAIEAHLTIVFTALAVSREAQKRSGLAIRNVLRQLRPLRSATISINGATQDIPPAVDARCQGLIDAIKAPSHFTSGARGARPSEKETSGGQGRGAGSDGSAPGPEAIAQAKPSP